jgi:3,4-dihydroxy 2-butanone 4-phosphate synthase/GTP cyclohydrolase II
MDGAAISEELGLMDGVQAAIEAFRRGETVIVTDDDDRENEGDLVCSASLCTPEQMAFIIRHTCGIVCAPVAPEIAHSLRLDPMTARNDAPLGTAFTISVDAAHGTTTGISAEERCTTVRALANGNSGPDDFVRPGHVFPLVARQGGVLIRSGHTEAAVDLCALADLPKVGVICELANDDGTVMKGTQIEAFAERHGLLRISVSDLIAFRQRRERLVARCEEFDCESVIGPMRAISYSTPFDSLRHFAFVYGDPTGTDAPLVRLHRSDIIGDVVNGAAGLHGALEAIRTAGAGVLVYLRDGAAGVPSTLPAGGDEGREGERSREWREIGVGAQILLELGLHRIRLLSSSERSYVGLNGYGLEIVEQKGLAEAQGRSR